MLIYVVKSLLKYQVSFMNQGKKTFMSLKGQKTRIKQKNGPMYIMFIIINKHHEQTYKHSNLCTHKIKPSCDKNRKISNVLNPARLLITQNMYDGQI